MKTLKNKNLILLFILMVSFKGYSQGGLGGLGGLGGGGGGGGSTGDSIGPAAAPCTVCNNPGFESGSGGGWSYDWGSDAQPGGLSATVCGAPHPQICVGGTGFTAPNHTIMTAGAFDPIAGGTILPVVPPFGGNKSLRLGDGNAVMGDGNGVGSMAARAKFTYRVQQSTANFTYRYAIVIEEPGAGFPAHLPNERPFFNAAVTDSAGNTISCGNLYVVAIPPITDFTEAADPKKTGRSDWYRGWSTVVLPLGAYIGQCVSIQFTTGDCGLGAHFGYAYIDASCDPAGAITVSPNACGGYLLAAPTNAHAYKWTNKAGGNTGIDGIDTNQTVNVNQAGTYVVNMSSLAGAACGIILEVTVGAPGPNPVSFVPFTGCSGSATQFTDTSTPSSPATGWAWDFNNDKLADAVIKNPTYTFPSSGTFPVTLTIYIGGCSATITQTVTVTKPTKPVVDPAGPFCVSAPPITLKTSISGGTWSGPGITNVSAGIFTPSAANIGNNQIIYATSADCPGKDTITIVIKGPAADAGRDIVICTGNTGNLGVPPTANIKYSWSPTTGLNSSTISNPTVTLTNNQSVTATYSYTVTATDTALNCAATDVVNVTVNPLPFVNAGPDQTICVGSTVTLNGSVSGATTSYTWSGGSGTFNPNNTSLNPVYTPNSFEISTGSVSLILTSNNLAPCPAATDQMVITINPVAIVNAGNDQTICIGSSANLAGSIGGSATTGTWSGGAGTFNPNNNDPNAAYTPSTTEGTAGGVTLTYTTDDPSGPCPAVTDQVKITINPLPTANAGPDQTICNGSAALAGSIGGSATSMIWSGGSGTFNPSNTSLNSNYTPSASEIAAGGVTISLTTNAAGACPPVTDQMAIKINPVAVVNAGPDQIICINSTTASNTVSLAGTFGGAATSGIWSGGSGTYSPNTSDPNAIYTLSGSETTNSNITLTYTANVPVGSPCPTVSDAMVISIDQVPTVNAGLDQTICSGSTVTLAGSIGGSATSATWSGGGGIYNPNNTSLNCVYTPTASEIALGSVALTLTTNDPAGPCTPANDQMIIIINPPALANVGSDQTICVGGTITLAGVYNGSASSGTWSGGAGTYSPNNTIANAIYTPSASENAAGTVTLTYTTNDPAGPCPAASAQMILTIDALPTVNAGTVQPVCSGANVTLNGSIGGSATSATWSGGTGTYSPDNTTLNATYTPSASEYSVGFVVLTLTTNDPAGPCPPASSNVTINFFPAPTVNFIVDDPDGCPVHCVKFTDLSTVSGGNSIVAWNWTFGDGGTSTLQSPSHCYSNTGKYDVSLSVTDNNSCTGTLKINTMITVYAFPVAEFYATPNPASTDNPAITFINQSSSDVTFWQWEFGDGDTIAGNNSKPTHTYPNTAATYQATLVVHNADFCYANVTHEITIQPVFSFFIPNAFTPHNGDGVDDFFFGKGVGIIQYDLWIFDRWGNMIFHGKDLNDKWDGKAYNLTEFGGNKEGKHIAQEDVFVWKVHLTDIFNNTHDYIGTVTLVK